MASKEAEIDEELGRYFDFASIPAATRSDEDPDPNEPVEYTSKTQLCDCETQEQARQLAEALLSAGIASWLVSTGRRYQQIMVAADQLEPARMIASQPIPQDIINDVKADMRRLQHFLSRRVARAAERRTRFLKEWIRQINGDARLAAGSGSEPRLRLPPRAGDSRFWAQKRKEPPGNRAAPS